MKKLIKRNKRSNRISSCVTFRTCLCGISYYIHNPYHPHVNRKSFKRGYSFYFRVSKKNWIGINNKKRMFCGDMRIMHLYYVPILLYYFTAISIATLLLALESFFDFISESFDWLSSKTSDVECGMYYNKGKKFFITKTDRLND